MTEALSKRRLRLWLRLLRTTRRTEAALRDHLRRHHATTLPRFDVMAALWRARDPLTMTELSRLLLVSNGNATAVVDRLHADGLVRRLPCPSDRRTVRVALTDEGARRFEGLAADHEAVLDGLLSDLGHDEIEMLDTALRRLKAAKATP